MSKHINLMNENLICPTDGVRINETKVRLVAGFVLLAALTYLFTNWLFLPVVLIADFGLRSSNLGRYSPFGNVAEDLIKGLKLPYKATDQAPKRFAARIGLVFAILITILHTLSLPTLGLAVILVLFAALESIMGFCAGCYVYTYFVRLFPNAA